MHALNSRFRSPELFSLCFLSLFWLIEVTQSWWTSLLNLFCGTTPDLTRFFILNLCLLGLPFQSAKTLRCTKLFINSNFVCTINALSLVHTLCCICTEYFNTLRTSIIIFGRTHCFRPIRLIDLLKQNNFTIVLHSTNKYFAKVLDF